MSPRRLSGSSASPRSRYHSIFMPYTYSLRCTDRNAPDGFNTTRTLTYGSPACPSADRTLVLPTLTLLGLLRLAGHSSVPPAPLCALPPGGPMHDGHQC